MILKGAIASMVVAPATGARDHPRASRATSERDDTKERGLTFGTLGAEGSNHSFVLRRYLAFRYIPDAKVELFQAFDQAFENMVEGRLDFILQVSVHPSHAEMVARYFNRVHIVDAFIAPSKPLAVVTRQSVDKPVSIALQPATRYYTDLSAWSKQIDEVSISTVAEGLLAGRYDSGLTGRELAEHYPERFRVDRDIGAATDTWVLFAREPIATGAICAWPQAPVTRLFIDSRR